MPVPQLDLDAVRRRLGRVGVWLGPLGTLPAAREREAVARIEELGYPTLWITESSKEIFAHASLVLGATERLVVGSGIANIWLRSPEAAASGANVLGESFPDRFVLGLGIGHAKFLPDYYRSPLATSREYLERMGAYEPNGPLPASPVPWVVAALRPKMLELARDRANGSHPYFVPAEHTALAREALGPDSLLLPEVAVVLDADATSARATARQYMALYLQLPNYTNNLKALGYTDQDLAGGGSDRLVDAVVPWGDVETIRRRVLEHLDAGADHVAIQPIDYSGKLGIADLAELAPALIGA